jgi:DNA-3-methyladenine glycosylase
LPAETAEVARFLIGRILVRDTPEGRIWARIVETEAYLPGDAASHAFRGQTARNVSMFLRPGHAYVYFIYGTAHCLNISSDSAGVGAAVLLRAAEPLGGLEIMQRNRGPATRPRDLARGPGRLAAAFGLDRTFDGVDLFARGARLWLAAGDPPGDIACGPRIGITRDVELPLRFFVPGSPFVSGTRLLAGFAPKT